MDLVAGPGDQLATPWESECEVLTCIRGTGEAKEGQAGPWFDRADEAAANKETYTASFCNGTFKIVDKGLPQPSWASDPSLLQKGIGINVHMCAQNTSERRAIGIHEVTLPTEIWSSGEIIFPSGMSSNLLSPAGFTATVNGGEVMHLMCDLCKTPGELRLRSNEHVLLTGVAVKGADFYRVPEAVDGVESYCTDEGAIYKEATAFRNGSIYINLPTMDDISAPCTINSSVPQEGTLRVGFTLHVAASLVHAESPRAVSHQWAVYDTSVVSVSSQLHRSISCPPDCKGGGRGINYVRACQGYTQGSACLAAETAASCAYGAAPHCSPCPPNAYCPGGFEAWPRQGYWASEVEGPSSILQCPPPSTLRCRGWSEREGKVQCGRHYDPNAPVCGACVEGYFENNGRCFPCPLPSESSSRTTTVLAIAGGALTGMFIVVGLYLSFGFHFSRIPTSKALGWRIAFDFIFWLLTTVQILLQVCRLPTPGMTPELQQLFTYLKGLQLETDATSPPECTGASPFLYSNIVALSSLSSAGTFVLILGVRTVWARKWGKRAKFVLAWGQFFMLQASILIFPLAVEAGLSVFDCLEVKLSGVDGEEAILVWWLNTRVRCYQGDHKEAVMLAVPSLVLGVLLILGCISIVSAKRVVRLQFQAQKTVRRRIVSQCCSYRYCCGLAEDESMELRAERAWASIFNFGQPWLRPAVLFHMVIVALVARLVPLERFPIARGAGLAVLYFGFGFILLFPKIVPDLKWGKWKRIPRSAMYLTTGGLVMLQSLLITDDFNQSSTWGTMEETTDRISPYHPSTAVVVMSWIVFVSSLGLPFVILLCMLVWSFRLLGCWCISSDRPKNARSKALVEYLSEQPSEGAVRNLVKTAGLNKATEMIKTCRNTHELERVAARAMQSSSWCQEQDSRTSAPIPVTDCGKPQDPQVQHVVSNLPAGAWEGMSALFADEKEGTRNPLHRPRSARHKQQQQQQQQQQVSLPSPADFHRANPLYSNKNRTAHAGRLGTFLPGRTQHITLPSPADFHRTNPLFNKKTQRSRAGGLGTLLTGRAQHITLPSPADFDRTNPLFNDKTRRSHAVQRKCHLKFTAEFAGDSIPEEESSSVDSTLLSGAELQRIASQRLTRTKVRLRLRDEHSIRQALMQRKVGYEVETRIKSYSTDLARVSTKTIEISKPSSTTEDHHE